MTSPDPRWVKSSFSTDSGCLETADLPSATAVRDSKNVDGPTLVFSKGAWAAFIAGVKRGEFDA